MATKTISITEEAYGVLKSRKVGNESFSEVITRSLSRHSLLELAGVLTHKEADELRVHVAERRAASRKRVDTVARRMQ